MGKKILSYNFIFIDFLLKNLSLNHIPTQLFIINYITGVVVHGHNLDFSLTFFVYFYY